MTIIYFNNGCKKVIFNTGLEIWYDEDGKIHRLDGPAKTVGYYMYERNGQKIKCFRPQWYYHGSRIFCVSQKEFEQFVRLRAFQ